MPPFNHFTTKAKEAVRRAHELAVERGQNQVSPMHLLAALVLQEDSIVATVLEKLDIDVMLLTDGRIAVLDWGIVGRLDPGAHGFLRHLVAGALGDDAAWDEIGQYLLAGLGPAADSIRVEDLVALIRPRLEAILTRPFGEFSLGSMLAEGQRSPDASAFDVEGRDNPLGPEVLPPVNRGMFLLGKQLLYFERYGQLHLGELSLLSDREFFAALLAEADLRPT
jgi:hypothetical protein